MAPRGPSGVGVSFRFLAGLLQGFLNAPMPLLLDNTEKEHWLPVGQGFGGLAAVFCGHIISFPVCAMGLLSPVLWHVGNLT